jgi:hypothetical protein
VSLQLNGFLRLEPIGIQMIHDLVASSMPVAFFPLRLVGKQDISSTMPYSRSDF